MIRILKIIILALLLAPVTGLAQNEINLNSYGSYTDSQSDKEQDSLQHKDEIKKKTIPSIIKTWQMSDYGASIDSTEMDTTLTYYHVYNPIYKKSISNTFTGNQGGAYESNNFFDRDPVSDFYFYNAYDAYALFPKSVMYLNTTTPYTLLDYSQSDNKNTRNETRFNVFHSQNANPKFNFVFLYDQSKSTGHYQYQENKYHNIGLITSYVSDKFSSYFNIIFNRYEAEENGGLESGQDLNEYQETETYLVNLTDAISEVRNNTIFFSNEYRLGKTETRQNAKGEDYDKFRPITGFIHQIEYSTNKRIYDDGEPNSDFYPTAYINADETHDTVSYNRLTNTFQLKFYEAPERKYTFSKRAFIGYDAIVTKMPGSSSYDQVKENYHNLFAGGAISRTEGTFWKWNAQGKIYLTGFLSGQTELSAYIYKPLIIGKDTTSLYLAGELNTLVPDYFVKHYNSNYYQWNNQFNNITEMVLHAKVQAKEYHLTLGAHYALISNYIFNNSEALPQQGGQEMLVLAGYINKDFIARHWEVRTQVLWQKSSQESYLHLPALATYLSINYKTVISKVMHSRWGLDIRYNTDFYADAYEPATGRYHWQNEQKIGNYPFVDLHANLKLKRTRAFFQLMNATTGLLDGNFWAAPDYPMYRRTFRLGIAWSFYD